MNSMKQLPSKSAKPENQEPKQPQTKANSDKKTSKRASKRSESLDEPPYYEIPSPGSDSWRCGFAQQFPPSTQAHAPNHPPEIGPQSPMDTGKLVSQVMAAANAGDVAATAELEQIFKNNPAAAQQMTDLSAYAKKMWLNKFFSTNPIVKQRSLEQLEKLREELLEDKSLGKLEQLLVDQIVMSQLQLNSLDAALSTIPFSGSKEFVNAISASTKVHQRMMNSAKVLLMLRSIKTNAP